MRKTESKPCTVLSQSQILGEEINTCAQLRLCREHAVGGTEQSPRLKENPRHSGVFLGNTGIGGGFRETVQMEGWSECKKDVWGW